MSEVLNVEKQGHFEVWTLNRPGALNAFNKPLLLELNVELDRVGDDMSVRCVVLCGAGGRAFSAGADLKERKAMAAADVPAFVDLIGGTFQRIAECPVPFVAAIDGYAFGGGLEIALACDIRAVGAGAAMVHRRKLAMSRAMSGGHALHPAGVGGHVHERHFVDHER